MSASYPEPEWLKEKYHGEGMSQAELDRAGIGAAARADGVIRVRTPSVDRYFEFIDGPPDAARAAKPGRFPR